jgi:hypothetical protein
MSTCCAVKGARTSARSYPDLWDNGSRESQAYEEVARGGIEPPTYRFSGGRSYQLSYLAVPADQRCVRWRELRESSGPGLPGADR